MTRARSFTKSEIMDAARAAAETGLDAKLCPTGEILFTRNGSPANLPPQSAEDAFEEWLRGSKARGLAHSQG